jgi:hypothetical protein
MINVIQGILPPHYLHHFNLGKHGLAHVPKLYHLNVLSPYIPMVTY